jgi:hypothetical protein
MPRLNGIIGLSLPYVDAEDASRYHLRISALESTEVESPNATGVSGYSLLHCRDADATITDACASRSMITAASTERH